MKRNGSKTASVMGRRFGPHNANSSNQPYGVTSMEHWEQDFSSLPFYTVIEKLLEVPDDIAGAIIRSVLKDERQSNAIIILADRFDKYHDERHRRMLIIKLAAMAATGGRARMEALFGAIRLLAPDMYRAILGMNEHKGKEKVQRGYDLRDSKSEDDS